MDKSFNPDAFIRRIGERLIEEFEDAKAGTTPSTVGSAAEQPVRDQLKHILPRGIAVGEGFVIDSYGKTSRQQDVVLYEGELCPVFSINDTPQTTFYPCEGVIATGEIKSSLDRNSLEDAFNKVASVKSLRRYVVTDSMPHPKTGKPIPLRRNYLSRSQKSIIQVDESLEGNEWTDVFGFVLAGECRMSRDALMRACCELSTAREYALAPNLLVTLDGYLVRWGNVGKAERKEIRKPSGSGTYGLTVHKDGPVGWADSWSARNANYLGISQVPDVFRMLVRCIRRGTEDGRTSHIRAFDRYFEPKPSGEPTAVSVVPKPQP